MDEKTVARFWAKVDKCDGDGCWMWTGAIQKAGLRTGQNYGRFRFRERSWKAHRVAWTLARGEIADGLLVCHRCDNPQCVRPDHMFLGTPKENTRDCLAKGRAAKATGPRNPNFGRRFGNGGKRGEANATAQLTEGDVVRIRAMLTDGLRAKDVAVRFGICPTSVYNIRARKSWGHVA